MDIRIEPVIGQLETHLIVALAGRAVGHGVGPGLARDFDLALGDQRPRDRGAEQISAFIQGVGAEHRKHIIAHEGFAQILDIDFRHTHHFRLGAGRFDLFALTQIGGKGDHFAVIGILQPAQNDRGVETAGISEYDLLHIGCFLGHCGPLFLRRRSIGIA